MEKLVFDSGIREFDVNGNGVLRFNPADINVYTRFLAAAKDIEDVERELVEKGEQIDKEDGSAALRLMTEADRKIKEILNHVFGSENDFDRLLGGVNLLAVASNGERVITNFLNALEPIVTDGAQQCARTQGAALAKEAQLNRAQRRAMK